MKTKGPRIIAAAPLGVGWAIVSEYVSVEGNTATLQTEMRNADPEQLIAIAAYLERQDDTE